MKAVIVECRNNSAVALRDDGTFIKIRNENYSPGEEIDINKSARLKNNIVHIASATKQKAFKYSMAAVASIMCTLGLFGWYMPYTYVNISGEKTVEYTLNRFGKILAFNMISGKTETINEDSKGMTMAYASIGGIGNSFLKNNNTKEPDTGAITASAETENMENIIDAQASSKAVVNKDAESEKSKDDITVMEAKVDLKDSVPGDTTASNTEAVRTSKDTQNPVVADGIQTINNPPTMSEEEGTIKDIESKIKYKNIEYGINAVIDVYFTTQSLSDMNIIVTSKTEKEKEEVEKKIEDCIVINNDNKNIGEQQKTTDATGDVSGSLANDNNSSQTSDQNTQNVLTADESYDISQNSGAVEDKFEEDNSEGDNFQKNGFVLDTGNNHIKQNMTPDESLNNISPDENSENQK